MSSQTLQSIICSHNHPDSDWVSTSFPKALVIKKYNFSPWSKRKGSDKSSHGQLKFKAGLIDSFRSWNPPKYRKKYISDSHIAFLLCLHLRLYLFLHEGLLSSQKKHCALSRSGFEMTFQHASVWKWFHVYCGGLLRKGGRFAFATIDPLRPYLLISQ